LLTLCREFRVNQGKEGRQKVEKQAKYCIFEYFVMIRNQQVAGSNPVTSSLKPCKCILCRAFFVMNIYVKDVRIFIIIFDGNFSSA